MSTTTTVTHTSTTFQSSSATTLYTTHAVVWKDTSFSHQVPHIAPSGTEDASGAHLVMMVHGLTRNARDFDHVAAGVVGADPEHTIVVAVDVVGRGKSDWLPEAARGEYGYPLYVEQLCGVLASVGSSSFGRVSWVGTSMGGLIGLMIAAKTGECPFSTLVLNDIVPFVGAAAVERIGTYLQTRHDKSFPDLDAVKAHFKECYAPFGIPDEEGWDHLVTHGVDQARSEEGAYVLACDPFIDTPISPPYEDVDMFPLWSYIAVASPGLKVALISGSESDLVTPELAARTAEEGLGLGAGAVVLDGIGHAPALMTEDQIGVVVNMLS